MTDEEAISIASRKAREIEHAVETRGEGRPALAPVAASTDVARVVSRAPAELSQTTIVVNERTREAFPERVRVARRFGG